MPSLISGYEYDIFISYRQKDNKYDGWVTEFVDNLKKELEATFKEDISVYFDINPSDYLLETYDVDATLKDKLKCLVFIPIISRTYCDPKSFAWEHEFKAFVELASKDQFGLKVRLPNGNVAGRMLPVRIHDLDMDDVKLCESVLGGALRGIEFIYKEPGVNKPLTTDDNEKKNLNNTKYRIQINKVANAIEEIILGMKNENVQALAGRDNLKNTIQEGRKKEKRVENEKPIKHFKIGILSAIIAVVLLTIAGIIAYPKIFHRNSLNRLKQSGDKISVVVMPFQNITSDSIWNVYQEGIQDLLIISLSNLQEYILVRQAETVNNLIRGRIINNYYKASPAFARYISNKLNADVLISGNIKRGGDFIRVSAQLIDSRTETVFKSFQIEENALEERMFKIADSLSLLIRNFLLISRLSEALPPTLNQTTSTSSPEALRYFISGRNANYRRDYQNAIKFYLLALDRDSNYIDAIRELSYSYRWIGEYQKARFWCQKIYQLRHQMSVLDKTNIERLYASIFETPREVIGYAKQQLEFDDQSPVIYYVLGFNYYEIGDYEKAIGYLNKSLKIYKNWKTKPPWINNYFFLSEAFRKTGQLRKAKKIIRQTEIDFPDNTRLLYGQVIIALTEGKTEKADQYIAKYISSLKEKSFNEPQLEFYLFEVYYEANLLKKAEEHLRKALAFDKGNYGRINNLANFLIDKEINIKEGLDLAERSLELRPENYGALHAKGWGLYKQGNYKEADKILQKSWDLRLEQAVYYHEAFLHLQAAKKAVAENK